MSPNNKRSAESFEEVRQKATRPAERDPHTAGMTGAKAESAKPNGAGNGEKPNPADVKLQALLHDYLNRM